MILRRSFGSLSQLRCALLTPMNPRPHVLLAKRWTSDKKKLVAPVTWKSFFGSMAILSVFFGTAYYFKLEKEKEMQRQRRRALGKAAIGGSFELIDYDGKPVLSSDFLGKWLLIYFGFTHCPDVCPDEMEKMCKVADILEEQKKEAVPIFITVDPERDSPPIVKSYCKEFSPKLLGLTGTKEQVDKATRAYRVYYSAGQPDATNDYIVDHTIIMYLVNPKGEFVDYYGQTKTAEEIANGVGFSMDKFEVLNKKSWFP